MTPSLIGNGPALAALKAQALAAPAPVPAQFAAGDDDAVAAYFNALASPDFYIWRAEGVQRKEFTSTAGVDVANGGAATTWSWPAFIARTVQEQTAWAALFADGPMDAGRPNNQQAISDIFSGNTNSAPAQRNHIAVIAKRKATRAEKVASTGTGSFASPGTPSFYGPVTPAEVSAARNA